MNMVNYINMDSEEKEPLAYHTIGQVFEGGEQLIKIKIKSEGGTPEEVAADMQENEGGSFRVARNEGNPDEGEYFLIKS